jgi:hypothetical protein
MTPTVDEAVWSAWLAKNRTQGVRRNAGRMTVVKWVSIAALVAAAAIGPRFAPFGLAALFAASAGAVAAMFQAADARRYGLATIFGVVALASNPVAPLFLVSGEGRAAAIASAAPFAVSLALASSRARVTLTSEES